jgi:hypothetical protein
MRSGRSIISGSQPVIDKRICQLGHRHVQILRSMIEAGNLVLVDSGRVHLSPPPQRQPLRVDDHFKSTVLPSVVAVIFPAAAAFGDNPF